jgi:hypothetical protein
VSLKPGARFLKHQPVEKTLFIKIEKKTLVEILFIKDICEMK